MYTKAICSGGLRPDIDFVVALQAEGDTLVTYDLSGRWRRRIEPQPSHIHYRVPALFDQSHIDRMLAYIPKLPTADEGTYLSERGDAEGDDIPRIVAGPVHNKLKTFRGEAVSFSHDHATKLDTAWEMLADDTETRTMSLDDISLRLFDLSVDNLSLPARLPLLSVLNRDSLRIRPSFRGNYAGTLYVIEPKDKAHAMEEVIEWARHYQKAASEATRGKTIIDTVFQRNPLVQFIQKARRAILQSRAHRSPTIMGTLGPSAATSNNESIKTEHGVAFSDHDRQILGFLISAVGKPPIKAVSVCTVRSMILRAVGAYPGMVLGVSTTRLFLQELGVLPPWHFIPIIDPASNVAGTGSVPKLDEMLAEISELAESDPSQCSKDMSCDIRTDWGDLAAFCIDSASTVDHDDAFSLDPVPGRDDRWWIRVHIADPGAFIPPDHSFARYAAKTRQSIYLADTSIAMLPREVTKQRFSIGRNRPVLTFSMLVSKNDGILETEIKPGRIHNVIFATPSALMKTLGGKESPSLKLNIKSDPHQEDVDGKFIAQLRPYAKTLKNISEIIKAVDQRREHKLADFYKKYTIHYDTQVSVSALSAHEVPKPTSHSQVYMGDPRIRVSSKSRLWSDMYSNDIVALVMLHANLAAAGWCRARGIPVPYVSCIYHPDYPLEKLLALKESKVRHLPSPRLTVEPERYENVGANEYTRVTSPLRRYWDLLAHWQIHAYLRHEAEEGSAVSVEERISTSFSFERHSIQEMISEYEHTEIQQKLLQSGNTVYWTIHALFRALHFQEGALPEVIYLPLMTRKDALSPDGIEIVFQGRTVPFGVAGRLLSSGEKYERGAVTGDIMPCRLSTVNVDLKLCYLIPIGPPLRDEIFTQNTLLDRTLDFTAAEYERLRRTYEINKR